MWVRQWERGTVHWARMKWRKEPGRSPEQEEPSEEPQSSQESGIRAGDTRGPTDRDEASGVGAQVRDKQPQSQGDTEDPEGLGRAGSSGD